MLTCLCLTFVQLLSQWSQFYQTMLGVFIKHWLSAELTAGMCSVLCLFKQKSCRVCANLHLRRLSTNAMSRSGFNICVLEQTGAKHQEGRDYIENKMICDLVLWWIALDLTVQELSSSWSFWNVKPFSVCPCELQSKFISNLNKCHQTADNQKSSHHQIRQQLWFEMWMEEAKLMCFQALSSQIHTQCDSCWYCSLRWPPKLCCLQPSLSLNVVWKGMIYLIGNWL